MVQRPAEHLKIGEVIEIAGSSSQVLLDASRLATLMENSDPSVSMAGQVGSQVKIRMGTRWLVANVRTQRMHQREAGLIVCQIDFLGEGEEEKLTGRIFNFRRGVTRYPVPGTPLFAMTSADLKQVYAADSRPHIEVG
ncbi:MAG: ATPase, partial [Blastomonas sp.]|nr:ATPase [Blastomonas sp.]